MKKITLFFFTLLLTLTSPLLSESGKKTALPREDSVQRIEITAGSYFFKPDHIVVKINLPVELKVKKEQGIVPHNIVSDSPEAGITFKVSLNKDFKIIRFTPDKTGLYPFYCDRRLLFFQSHREKGMEGMIEVIP